MNAVSEEPDPILPVFMPASLIRKMVKPWYLVKQWDAAEVRDAMRAALAAHDEQESIR